MHDAKQVIGKLGAIEREMDRYEWYRRLGFGDDLRAAAELIERLAAEPFDPGSEEGFAIRALRTAAERTDRVLITSNDGERIGIGEFGSYAAKLESKAVLAVLDRLNGKEACIA